MNRQSFFLSQKVEGSNLPGEQLVPRLLGYLVEHDVGRGGQDIL